MIAEGVKKWLLQQGIREDRQDQEMAEAGALVWLAAEGVVVIPADAPVEAPAEEEAVDAVEEKADADNRRFQ